MRFIERDRAGRRGRDASASRSRAADSLYVTDDFLVTHNTLNDSFVILDEAQNTTPEQMKMFLTRLGLRLEDGRHRRHHAGRPAARAASGLVVVGDILDGVDGIEFVRFGGEDVVRHKLVQRIVAAYDEHAARQAPELRPARPPPPARACSDVEVDVLGDALPAERVRRLVRARRGAGRRRGRPRRGRASSAPSEIAALNAEHRGKAGPTDVLSFPVDGGGRRRAGARELGDVVICPAHTEDLEEAVVHGVLHLVGMDHETDEGEMLALQAELLAWLR